MEKVVANTSMLMKKQGNDIDVIGVLNVFNVIIVLDVFNVLNVLIVLDVLIVIDVIFVFIVAEAFYWSGMLLLPLQPVSVYLLQLQNALP